MSKLVLTSYGPAKESSKNVNVLPYVTVGRTCQLLYLYCIFRLLIYRDISNVAEQLIDKGLASVVRHRRDDEDRSPDYDKLMTAEHS
jgi:hypothetical protein